MAGVMLDGEEFVVVAEVELLHCRVELVEDGGEGAVECACSVLRE